MSLDVNVRNALGKLLEKFPCRLAPLQNFSHIFKYKHG